MWLFPFGWYQRGCADYKRAGGYPEVSAVTYSDGYEVVHRDRRGRVTRHILVRSGRPYKDNCYKFVRQDGRTARVKITAEEWQELEDARKKPHPPKVTTVRDNRPKSRRSTAGGVDDDDWNTD